MDSPDNLTKIAGYDSKINLSEDDFKIPTSYDIEISGQTELNKINTDNDSEFLKAIISFVDRKLV